MASHLCHQAVVRGVLSLFCLALVACSTPVLASPSSLSGSRPNILFILSDDLGWAEVGVYPAKSPHGRIATPRLDQLANEGIQFTDAYAGEAVCAPSRCTLMTGLHTGHAFVRGNKNVDGHDLPLPADTVTVAEVLKEAGYWTGLVGKWGLGYNNTSGAPRVQGFDYYYGQLDQANCHNMYPPFVWANETQIHFPTNFDASRERCMMANNTCVWSHALFTNNTLEVLKERAADKSKPWYLFVSYTDPHAGGWSWDAKEQGAPVPSDGVYASEPWPDVEKDHASVIGNYQDRDVGRILDLVEELGMAEDTVVFFASDNGAHNEGGHSYKFFDSTGPLRGYKRSLYEGGIRSPSLIRWKGKIPAQQQSAYPWAFWDFLPTAADLAGVDASKLPQHLDGLSLVPLLSGDKQPAHEYLYWEFCTRHNGNAGWGHAVRSGDWKAVAFFADAPLQLYNVTEDIGETNDVAEKFPEVVQRMKDYATAAHTPSKDFPIANCHPSL